MPVVIDDALGFTDPDRLAKMGKVFDTVGAHGQVIVLTCSPDRYDGVKGAHRIDLRRLARRPLTRRRTLTRKRGCAMDIQCDYVVVGTGSAGAVVTNRLSADPATAVVALEAGPPDKNRFIGIPAAFSKLFRSEVDWDYLTEPQPEPRRSRRSIGPEARCSAAPHR